MRCSMGCAGGQLPSPPKESDPGVEVRLLIQTSSANAQHQLDRLQRAANNNDLQNLVETQGEILRTRAASNLCQC